MPPKEIDVRSLPTADNVLTPLVAPQRVAPSSTLDMTDLLSDIATRVRRIERVLELVPILLAAHGDPTHVSVPDAARVLGVSQRTIRRKIARGELTLDVIADGRKTGIAVEQLYEAWIPLRLSKQSFQREKERLARG